MTGTQRTGSRGVMPPASVRAVIRAAAPDSAAPAVQSRPARVATSPHGVLGPADARSGLEQLVRTMPEPAYVLTHDPAQMPYGVPERFKVERIPLGQPLDLTRLDPDQTYIWVVDEAGTFHLAPERQAGFGVTAALPDGRPLKHGDLTPEPDGSRRGPARVGGELKAQRSRVDGHVLRAADGQPRWILNNTSSYVFNREGPGGVRDRPLSARGLRATHAILARSGTDLSHVRMRTYAGMRVLPLPAGAVDAGIGARLLAALRHAL